MECLVRPLSSLVERWRTPCEPNREATASSPEEESMETPSAA